MTDTALARAPVHLWIVGILSLLWNAMGALDYSMTELHNETYLAGATPEQLAYFASFPAWAVGAWACGVWGAFAGSVLLLLRSRFAFHAFLLGLAGLAVTTVFQFSNPLPGSDISAAAIGFTAAIWLSQLLLAWYARQMTARGVLR